MKFKYAFTALTLLFIVSIFTNCRLGGTDEEEPVDPPEQEEIFPNYGSAASTDFRDELVYYVQLDRFFDGNSANNDGNIPGATDEGNWEKYWGGDLDGLASKLDYLKGMGVTAICINPLVDNIDQVDASGRSAYHGFWGRDYFKLDEHWGQWQSFDDLVQKMHSPQYGMKLIMDFSPNHSSPADAAEYAALYRTSYNASGAIEETVKLTDYAADEAGHWYHRIGTLPTGQSTSSGDWNDPYFCRYKAIGNLADFNQEEADVSQYLIDSAELWLRRGVDALRLDSVKNIGGDWLRRFVLSLEKRLERDIYVMGDWVGASALNADGSSLDSEAKGLGSSAGIAVQDYGFRNAIQALLSEPSSMRNFSSYLSAREAYWPDVLSQPISLDGPDSPRIGSRLSFQGFATEGVATRIEIGLALLMTLRGIPLIYYGTEDYAASMEIGLDGNPGSSPYNREWKAALSDTGKAFRNIKALAALRKASLALQNGSYVEKHLSDDCVVYERKSGADVVVVFVNLGADTAFSLNNLSLPNGHHSDVLGGAGIEVSFGNADISLQANSIIVVSSALAPSYSIRGTIRRFGSPLPGVSLRMGALTTTTDYEGKYVFSGLGNGSYEILPELGTVEFSPESRSVNLAGDNVNGMDFDADGYMSNFDSMYLRGDFNGWSSGSPMELINDSLWSVSGVPLSEGVSYGYKYEISGTGSWLDNWGQAYSLPDNGSSGTAVSGGNNIMFIAAESGPYTFTFNDQSLAFTVIADNPTCALPTFSQEGGEIPAGTDIVISSATEGSTIHYSTDGSTPTGSSPAGPAGTASALVRVNAGMTLRAIALKDGWNNSKIASASYTVPVCSAPSFSLPSSAVAIGTSLTLTSASTSSTIYYTTDGSTPNTSSNSGPSGTASASLTISAAMVVRAIAVRSGFQNSSVSSASYLIIQCAAPVFGSSSGSTIISGSAVSLSCPTPNSTIYYTLDGSDPTSISQSGPVGSAQASITLSGANNDVSYIRAIALRSDYRDSNISEASYIIQNHAGWFTLILVNGTTAQNLSFPGDFNNWSLAADNRYVAPSSTVTIDWPASMQYLTRGASTTKLDLLINNGSTYTSSSRWNFSTWTRSANIGLVANGGYSYTGVQITCLPTNEVILTVDVGAKILNAVVR